MKIRVNRSLLDYQRQGPFQQSRTPQVRPYLLYDMMSVSEFQSPLATGLQLSANQSVTQLTDNFKE